MKWVLTAVDYIDGRLVESGRHGRLATLALIVGGGLAACSVSPDRPAPRPDSSPAITQPVPQAVPPVADDGPLILVETRRDLRPAVQEMDVPAG